METAVTFATSDIGKLNSIKDFIRSLDVSKVFKCTHYSRRRHTSAY